MGRLNKEKLEKLYLEQKKSCAEIASILKVKTGKVNYWMKKYGIPKRSISDAIYVKANPDGDPFSQNEITDKQQAFLYGLGLGLYWGEGTKSDKNAVRLGNTDPNLIKKFIEFLETIYNIKSEKLSFGLQVFNDMSPEHAVKFWSNHLSVSKNQFQKVVTTSPRGKGTYSKKTKHGVLTVYFYNTKLRDIICRSIEEL